MRKAAAGKICKDIPNDTQYLLCKKRDKGYCVMLPLISGDLKASICGSEDSGDRNRQRGF